MVSPGTAKPSPSSPIKNDDGFNAKEVAEDTNDSAVLRALCPDEEQSDLARLAAVIVLFLLYIVAWVNAALNRVVRWASPLTLNRPLHMGNVVSVFSDNSGGGSITETATLESKLADGEETIAVLEKDLSKREKEYAAVSKDADELREKLKALDA